MNVLGAVIGKGQEVHAGHGHRDYRHPPERKSMHARIVRDLGMRIVAGEFKPGDRLPFEAALLEEYDVSRPVLREATRVLVAKGLVQSRQRAGATVRPRSDWHLLDPDVLYWLIQTQPPPKFVETLLAARRVFEPAAAALAAKVDSDEALEGIAAERMDTRGSRNTGSRPSCSAGSESTSSVTRGPTISR